MSEAVGTEFSGQRHPGPALGPLAVVFTVVFILGLLPVTAVGGMPYFPGPWESAQTIDTFFRLRPGAALLCAFLQFGSAIPLGLFTATITSRLRFLGVKAAGAHIALFGGLTASAAIASSSLVLWAIAQPGISSDTTLTAGLYYVMYALGGPGYSVPLGLLIAGVSVTCWFYKLLPRWICIFGLVLAVCGELSWLNLEFPKALFLIPLTRFPGFIWMIAAGFALPARTRTRSVEVQ
ncbi:hypothetical protein [Tunturiibacter lichenicola]|uniref:hypothetical protein n=1 Tax=Tunturiibacter lichenicola TaxID=2051959 RepID=UPI0021B436B1|nr:hypothetical protein [Edaphobacter lichenicola]